jgi:aminoglycoside 3-N-acetyltransferase
MAATRRSLARDLVKLGLRAGEIVMVHASVRAIGPVIGGPDEIHIAVEETVAPGGAMLMYVGCQHGFDDVGRRIFSGDDEREILASLPAFDFRHARASRDFGILAEFFRSHPGTQCSRSVGGRMAARGDRGEWLVADHPWNYGYGKGSPLDKLCMTGGKVLLLGSHHDEVTLLHYAEHIAPFEGKRIVRYKSPLMQDGARSWVDCEEFDTSSDGVHANWPPDAFAQIVDDFIENAAGTPACHMGQVGHAQSVLMDAAALVEHAMPIMTVWAAELSGG